MVNTNQLKTQRPARLKVRVSRLVKGHGKFHNNKTMQSNMQNIWIGIDAYRVFLLEYSLACINIYLNHSDFPPLFSTLFHCRNSLRISNNWLLCKLHHSIGHGHSVPNCTINGLKSGKFCWNSHKIGLSCQSKKISQSLFSHWMVEWKIHKNLGRAAAKPENRDGRLEWRTNLKYMFIACAWSL